MKDSIYTCLIFEFECNRGNHEKHLIKSQKVKTRHTYGHNLRNRERVKELEFVSYYNTRGQLDSLFWYSAETLETKEIYKYNSKGFVMEFVEVDLLNINRHAFETNEFDCWTEYEYTFYE